MTAPTIVAIGELLVEFVSHQPDCGLRELAEYSGPYPSGAPAIFVDQAARMGARTRIIGSVGNDNFGSALIDRLRADGVVTAGIDQSPDKTTGVAFVSYYQDGSRTFIFHLTDTAADAVRPRLDELPAGPLILHVSGSSLGNMALRLAIEQVVSAVLERGGKISIDPNARPELMSDPVVLATLDAIIGRSTYVFPSTSDLEFLYPGKTEDQVVQDLRGRGAKIVGLKRGALGASVYSKSGRLDLPAYPVQEIDPTGAGDCFCGTFLAMVAAGQTPEAAGRMANAAGALAVQKRGPMEGNSDPAAIEQLIAAAGKQE